MASSTFFLSYSRKDDVIARQIANSLRNSNFNVWFDQFDIPNGNFWDFEIEKALKNCQAVIFILSKDSVNSNNVLNEISFALDHNKKIIPVKINDCIIPFRINRHQYIEFGKDPTVGLEELKKTLGVNETEIDAPIKNVSKSFFKKYIYLFHAAAILITIIYLTLFFGGKKAVTSIPPKVYDNQSNFITSETKDLILLDAFYDNKLQAFDLKVQNKSDDAIFITSIGLEIKYIYSEPKHLFEPSGTERFEIDYKEVEDAFKNGRLFQYDKSVRVSYSVPPHNVDRYLAEFKLDLSKVYDPETRWGGYMVIITFTYDKNKKQSFRGSLKYGMFFFDLL